MRQIWVIYCVFNFALSAYGKTVCNDRLQLDLKELNHKQTCTLKPLKTNMVARLYDCASMCLYENQCWMISVHHLENKMIKCSLFNNTCEGSFENTNENFVAYAIRVVACRKSTTIALPTKKTSKTTKPATTTTTESLTTTKVNEATPTTATPTTAKTDALITTITTTAEATKTTTTTTKAPTTTTTITEAPTPTTKTEALTTTTTSTTKSKAPIPLSNYNDIVTGNYHDSHGDATFRVDLASLTKPYPLFFKVTFSEEVDIKNADYSQSISPSSILDTNYTVYLKDLTWYTQQYLNLKIYFNYPYQTSNMPYVASFEYDSIYCEKTR